MHSYITDIAVCLPGQPVANDRMEDLLGKIDGKPSMLKELMLAKNGIKTRYYAIDPATGKQTHNNAQLTAEALRRLAGSDGFDARRVDVLACGTSSPDQLIPSHAVMVHGESGLPACEVVSTAGVCCSSIAALKYASMAVAAGHARTAVATGSEVASSVFRARQFPSFSQRDPARVFEQEFLRWMLSDGAGAVHLAGEPRRDRLSLRIDWLDLVSYANELETCMFTGAVKRPDGSLQGWRDSDDPSQLHAAGYFNLTQDLKVLDKYLMPVAFRRSLERVRQRRELEPEAIDWLLVHMSSEFFRKPIQQILTETGCHVPDERWFTNLNSKGNTGSASCFIMLEELLHSGRLERRQRVLCVIPESARFTFAYMQLTVV